MSAETSYSPTLVLRPSRSGGREIACRACGHALSPANAAWKEHAAVDERPLAEVGGPTFRAEGGGVLLRRFWCPSCGAALDSETALPGEPFLVDVVRG